MPLRSVVKLEDFNGNLLLMPTLIKDPPYLTVKILTIYPENPYLRKIPSIQGLILLFQAQNGTPLALMDAASLTALRTGAIGGLATKYLAREDAQQVALFGAGVQAGPQLEAVCSLRPIKVVKVFSKDDPREKDFCSQMSKKLQIEIHAVLNPEEAVRNADIIICATTSKEPLFDGRWLKPGAHITAIGSYSPDAREVDTFTVKNSRVFVDYLPAAKEEAGDLIIPIEEGEFSWSEVQGDMTDLVTKRVPGRINPQEITLFKTVGIGLQDAVIAYTIYERAKNEGIGIQL